MVIFLISGNDHYIISKVVLDTAEIIMGDGNPSIFIGIENLRQSITKELYTPKWQQ
jgi:hypothetical protein